MRTYNLTYTIDFEKEIVFKSKYAHIEERDGARYCSVRGEFFEKDQPYNPPMRYELTDWPVPTQNINDILRDKYKFLVMSYYPDLAEKLFQKK